MSHWTRSAELARKLVALARSPNANEAARAAEKAAELIRNLDLELLETLAGQREKLLADWEVEQRRLWERNARPNAETREMLSRAMTLFRHYKAIDVLPAAVELERLRARARDHLTPEEGAILDRLLAR